MAVLHIADYVIFGLSIVASFAIGIYYACRKDKNKSTEDYLVASRKMNLIPVAISLLVSTLSSIVLLGNATEIYYFSFGWIFTIVAFVIGLAVTSFTFVPLFHGLKLTSVHGYLLLRYQTHGIVYLCCFLQNISFCLVNGVAMYTAAMVINSIAGFAIRLCMVVTGVVATIYTTIGGYHAVVWCDVFQAAIIFIGIIVIDVLGIMEVGSISEIFQIYQDHERISVNFSFSPFERNTFWAFTLGFAMTILTVYGIMQTVAQRYISLKTLKEAKCSIYYSMIQSTLISCLSCFSGIVAFSYYAKLGCDPLAAKKIINPNQIIPYFIQDVLHYPCVRGLFMACIFCATLANLSSTLNSISALVWDDILKHKLAFHNLPETKKSLITKIIAFCAGIVSTLCAFVVSEIGGTVIEITLIIGSVSLTPVSIMIVLGAVSSKTSWKTALIGAVLGTSLVIWMFAGHTFAHIPPQIKPLATTNCTYAIHQGNATTLVGGSNFTEYLLGTSGTSSSVNMSTTGESSLLKRDSTNGENILGLYKVSFMWYTPSGLVVGLLFGILFSFVPGLGNKEGIRAELLFPFVAYILRKKEYFSHQASTTGIYTANTEDREMSLCKNSDKL